MLETRLKRYQQHNLLRKRVMVTAKKNNWIKINNTQLINFASNDYLNLSTHPQIKKSLIQGVEKHGIGSTASPLVSGYHYAHQQLEEAFADFTKRDRALLFSSGYLANVGLMSALADRHTTIISDKYCHASLLDGIQLTRAKHLRYRHHDLGSLENLLKKTKKNDLLVTESIFSMEGKITDIRSLAKLAQQSNTLLVVDDAHGFGVLGEAGGGICEKLTLNQDEVPYLVIAFGKAVGGMGAIVAGSHANIEKLIQLSRSYRYSTALPPALAVAAYTSLRILKKENWRRKKLYHLIEFFNQQARLRELPLVSYDLTPIKSILTGNNQHTIDMQTMLMQNGFFVSAIRPPTVEVNRARIRLSLSCLHSEENILKLLNLLATTLHEKKS